MTDAHQVEIVQQKHNSKDEQNNRPNRDIVLARWYCLRLRINLNRGRSGHIGIYRRRGCDSCKPNILSKPSGSGAGRPNCLPGRLVSFKRHVDWEKCSEQRKDDLHAFLQVAVQRENQHDKNDHMDKCLYELPVVHGAYTGNEAQKACNRGLEHLAPEAAEASHERRRSHMLAAGRRCRVRSKSLPSHRAYSFTKRLATVRQ